MGNKAIHKYILGELSQGEVAILEKRLICDEDFATEFLVIWDEMVDRFVQGKMKGAEKAQFERRMQQLPGLRRKVVVEAPISRWVTQGREEDNSLSWWERIWRWPIVIPVVAAMTLLIWFVGWGWNRKETVPPMVSVSPTVVPVGIPSPAPTAVAQMSPRPRIAQARYAPVVLYLSGRLFRGNANVPTAIVTKRGPFAIQVEVPTEAKVVSAELTSNSFQKSWSKVKVKRLRNVTYIELVLPSITPAGSYTLTIDSDITHTLEIQKKM